MGQTSDSDKYLKQLQLYLISILVNFSCELETIITSSKITGNSKPHSRRTDNTLTHPQ